MSALAPYPARRGSSSLRRALALSSGGTAGARIAGAIGGLLAARLLGPTGRGQLAILVVLATAASMAAAAGLQFWIAREVACTRGVRSVGWVAGVHAMVIVAGMIVLGVVGARTAESLAAVGPLAFWATIAFAATNALQLVILALPNGLRAMGAIAVAVTVAGCVYVATVAGLLIADRHSIAFVLLGGVAGNILSIVIALGWTARAPRGEGASIRGRVGYGHALRFGLPAGAGELVLLAMLRVDVLIVALFLPLRAVGLYAVATALAELLWIIPDGVAQVVLPTTARDPAESRTPRLIRLTVVLTAASGVLLLIAAHAVFQYAFGTRYVGATSAVPFLVVASLGGAVWKIVGAEIVALGRARPRLTSAVLGLVAMVGVDLVAVPAIGIAGAALGSACGYTIAAGVVVRSWSREVGRPARELLGITSPGAVSLPSGVAEVRP